MLKFKDEMINRWFKDNKGNAISFGRMKFEDKIMSDFIYIESIGNHVGFYPLKYFRMENMDITYSVQGVFSNKLSNVLYGSDRNREFTLISEDSKIKIFTKFEPEEFLNLIRDNMIEV